MTNLNIKILKHIFDTCNGAEYIRSQNTLQIKIINMYSKESYVNHCTVYVFRVY